MWTDHKIVGSHWLLSTDVIEVIGMTIFSNWRIVADTIMMKESLTPQWIMTLMLVLEWRTILVFQRWWAEQRRQFVWRPALVRRSHAARQPAWHRWRPTQSLVQQPAALGQPATELLDATTIAAKKWPPNTNCSIWQSTGRDERNKNSLFTHVEI